MESSEVGTSSGNEYQVFLNFRRPDTRKGFTDFLYHSLTDAGINVFLDDEELPIGERIDRALPRAIDNSRIYIPIFSQTYASSQWCLRELAQIVENASKSNGHKEILPIFFDVEPDDVKLKNPLYRDAILNLEREKKLSTEQVDSWREALKNVDAIKGWEVKKYNGQGKLIKLVVKEVINKLKIKQKSVTEHLIGIDDRVVAVKDLLDVGSGGGRLIQIHGMGGIGKTTLAKVVFNQLSTHFGKYCYFLEDVREKSSRKDGLVELQRKLLSEIGSVVGTRSIDATEYGMKRIEETLRNKKVFIVLDDVDESEQVEKLVGKGVLCSGSRVLITTRNKDVSQITGPKYDILTYEMEVMSSDCALQLFSRYAFNKDSPLDDWCDISKKIVSATGRLPLTIEVIGSYLHNKTQELWKETLNKLSKTLLEGVFKKLKISYDALTFGQQQIFLDVACFFIGEEQTNAIHMWRDCDFFPDIGIAALKSMSLIKIVKGNVFWMHDQLRDLGREIVRKKYPMNPEKHDRLWIEEEVLDAIRTRKMKNVQAMELEWIHEPICINGEEIGRFKNLRFLRLYNGTFVGNLMDCFPKVRWIDCNDFDLKCELTNMCLKNLVVLNLFNIANMDDRKLWSLTKEARKLKVLSLSDCHRIIKTPDLSGCSTLERLTFQSCHGLRKIDGSIGKLKCLIDLQFVDCPQLEGLPEEIGGLQNLEHFSLHNCYEIEGLPDSIYKWKSLRELYLSIQGPVELSAAIQKLGNLEVLWINTDLKGQLPFEIGLLPQLQKLVLKGYYEIRELPALPISLTHLTVSFASFHVPKLSNLTNLVELELHEDFEIDERNRRIHASDLRGIRRLSKPEQLESCLFHVHAPNELASLPKLNRLYLSGLSLQTIENCKSTALLSSNLENLSDLKIIRCQMREVKFDGLQLPNLTVLYLDGCEPLEKFMLSSMRKLKKVSMNDCPKLDEIHIAGVLESLEELHIRGCVSLKRLVYVNIQWESSLESSLILASGVFNKLRKLRIGYCHKILSIQVVGTLESLEELSLFCCDHLQSLGLSNLKNLKPLNIAGDHEQLIVEGHDELKFSNDLDPYDCQSLESPIDVATSQLPNDCQLYIHNCPKLRGVKQGFEGSIQCFKNHKVS